jgi:type IV pilus assembly protein PilW
LFPLPLSRPPRRPVAGFSLVEIMVGMVIGMLGLIIMMQVFSLSESQKRTTTGGGDAQSSGAIALYGLQRDIRQAGYGVTDVKLLGCNLLLRAGVTLSALAPLTINHASITGQDANTDTLLLVYGNSNGSPQGDGIITQPALATYTVQTPTSFTGADRVIATPQNRASPCSLVLDTVTGVVIPVAPVTTSPLTLATGVASMAGGTLFNLGQTPKVLAYAIRGGKLTVCDYLVNDCGNAGNNASTTIWVPIADNIVSLKAQYGRDTVKTLTPLVDSTMDGIVDWYDQTTPPGPSATPVAAQGAAQPAPPMALAAAAPTYLCAFARISAVRLALVARNANFEKTAVTTLAPVWEGSVAYTPADTDPPTIGWTGNPIVLTGNATWQNYRYRVIQTVVPLRNLAWQGVPTGC